MRPRACITAVVLVTAILLGETVVAQTSHQQTANTSNAAAAFHPLTKAVVSASSSITAPIQFTKVDGLNIAYKVIGQGKPIIFLARFRGTLNDWDPAFVDAVAKSYRVILFDAPGVGRSAGVVSTSVTKWADQAAHSTWIIRMARWRIWRNAMSHSQRFREPPSPKSSRSRSAWAGGLPGSRHSGQTSTTTTALPSHRRKWQKAR